MVGLGLLVLQATILQRHSGKSWHWLNGLFACTRAHFDGVDRTVVGFFTIAKLATTCCEVLMSAMKADRPAYCSCHNALPDAYFIPSENMAACKCFW